MKKILIGAGLLALAGCSDAEIASRNISTAANNFEVMRRIVFYNGITNDYILVIEGLCSQEHTDRKFVVTCKTSATEFKKHFLGLSDNVTYFSEQVDGARVNTYHYRVIFKPAAIVPNFEVKY